MAKNAMPNPNGPFHELMLDFERELEDEWDESVAIFLATEDNKDGIHYRIEGCIGQGFVYDVMILLTEQFPEATDDEILKAVRNIVPKHPDIWFEKYLITRFGKYIFITYHYTNLDD